MSTVIRGRARPSATPSAQPAEPMVSGNPTVVSWAQKKAINMLKRQIFAFELEQGLVTEEEIKVFNDLDVPLIEETVRNILAEIELNKSIYGEVFENVVKEAVEKNDLDFDFQAWNDNFRGKLADFQDYEVVFFRNRTTAFTLPKPCPNCGQKKLVAEGQVFTRAADEAASQFATCKNCSSRFRLQSVL